MRGTDRATRGSGDRDGVVIPALGLQLLVPAAVIAEVASLRRLREDPRTPDWHLGTHSWRERQVPVLSFERLRDPSVRLLPRLPGATLVVLHRTRPGLKTAFYGIAALALPRMIHLEREDFGPDWVEHPGRVVAMSGKLGDDEVIIPDFAALEDAVATL